MDTWSRARALGVTLGTALLLSGPVPAEASSGGEPVDVREVMLADLGEGWRITDEQVDDGVFIRTFASAVGVLSLQGFAVDDPPGVRSAFDVNVAADAGLEQVPEPTLDFAVWFVAPGGAPGDDGLSSLVFGARDHLFTVLFARAEGAEVDGPALVLDVARRQIAAAGGPPRPEAPAPAREVDDSQLLPLLPESPPQGFGLGSQSKTIIGPDAGEVAAATGGAVAEFSVRRSKTVTRAWAGPELGVAVWITEYPYEVLAASVHHYSLSGDRQPIGDGEFAGLPDAVAFRKDGQIGIVFRRGHIVANVLVTHRPEAAESAAALVSEMAALTAGRLPPGDTEPYDPTPPSRLVGLALTVAFVGAAAAGSRGIALLRARRVRRRWAGDEPPQALPPPGSPPTVTIDLDADAAALRRRGWELVGLQFLTFVVGVVALAGDFGLPGMVVAGASLVVGLAVSRWWVGRELSLLGPRAPDRRVVFPRLPGALLALLAFAVLGIGVAFLLKGIRYLALPITVAQLRWSDIIGISPRAVGIAFAIGGLLAAMFGGALYRAARSVSRSGVRQALQADPRPPALYLRSFADDALQLPAVASARRPFFELFSLRGADPFEEAVAWELSSYAPVVAVGRPGGTLRSLGAAREHLAQETWRDEIAERMRDAAVIVLAPGETAGLAWELAEIVRGDHLAKSIFLFPPLAPTDLRRRWHHTAQLLRDAGADVGHLTAPATHVHTLRIGRAGALLATVASTRDEATYRTAIDRAAEPPITPAADAPPAVEAVGMAT